MSRIATSIAISIALMFLHTATFSADTPHAAPSQAVEVELEPEAQTELSIAKLSSEELRKRVLDSGGSLPVDVMGAAEATDCGMGRTSAATIVAG